MASVGNRWVRTTCPSCAEKRNFTINADWRITCPDCGHERGLVARKHESRVTAEMVLQD